MGHDGNHTGISRRAALKRIGAGAAVAWSAPVVLTVGASALAGSPAPGTCPPGFANCDGSGCNCPTSATNPGCCNSACQTVHSNGLGQSYYDCSPIATYSETSAFEACSAYTGNPGACSAGTCGGSTVNAVCGSGSLGCACWQYSGTAAGHVSTPSGNASCFCPSTADAKWN